MHSGGGGAPPPPAPPPSNGGEYLLQLLQNPHHPQASAAAAARTPQATTRVPVPSSPLQSLSLDPAVAAVGPAVPFPTLPSNGYDLPHPWANPPNYLIQGLAQNPWPPQTPQFIGDRELLGEDVRRLGFDVRGKTVQHQQHHKLMFGSFPCEIQNHGGLVNGKSLENPIPGAIREPLVGKFDALKNHKMGLDPIWNLNSHHNASQQEQERRTVGWGTHQQGEFSRSGPPPGFPSKARGVGNCDSGILRRGLEDKVNKGNVTANDYDEKVRRLSPRHVDNHGNASAQLGLTGQLEHPGPLLASDIEECLLNLGAEIDGVGDRVRHQKQGMRREGQGNLDDLSEEMTGSLVLEDGSQDKNDTNQHHNSRNRDFRSDTRGQRMLSQRVRNLKRHMECRRDIGTLNFRFLSIYESLIPEEEEKAKQKQLLTLLEKLVSKEWPKAQLFLYGSCANSFGVSKSDIDVCLAIDDADINKSEFLLKLADILQSDNLQNVQALTRARVPIVKLKDPVTGISCDICINNVLAVVNTKLLRDYAQIDVRLRQLAFIVKHWAKSRGVNETYQGTLSSYAYVLMCIHFLQQRKPAILPCLQGMQTTYSVTVDDIQCAFFDQVERLRHFGSHNKESIAQLVWAFFNYWAYHHDYANDVISIRTGSIISKREKDWTRRKGNDRHLICIEDPFEISHDLGRVVDKFSIKVLREEFERAAYIMQYDPDPCVTLFEPYVPCFA